MKKLNVKSFITGVMLTILVTTMINTVFAEQISKTITAVYNNIKITIDGKQIEPKDANGNIVEPFVSNGTTYLPVRSIADAVGYDVEWDGNTSTVKLTKKIAQVATGYGRTNPAPIGTAQTLIIDDYGDEYTITMKIKSVISGDEAWKLIYDENQFNDPAPEGKIYIIANIECTVNKINSDKAITFSGYDCKAFSGTNVAYESKSVVEPDPEFYGKVFEGGTLVGNTVFLVDKSDSSPKMVYGMEYDGTGGIWFALN